MPYHVDRSKLFVMDRFAKAKLLDATRIAHAVEFTRFPVSTDDIGNEEGMLVRAANLIGQLGDPHYLRKANALYYEFEEAGMNKQLGYDSPADLTDQYPKFYWNSISPFIQSAIRYLNVTSSGRQWIANVYSNIFSAERALTLYGPNAETGVAGSCRRVSDIKEKADSGCPLWSKATCAVQKPMSAKCQIADIVPARYARLFDLFDLAYPPSLVEEQFLGTVQSQQHEPALARVDLNPVPVFHAFWFSRSYIDDRRSIRLRRCGERRIALAAGAGEALRRLQHRTRLIVVECK